MVYEDVEELAAEIYESIKELNFISGVSLNIEGPILRARLLMNEDIFIDIYFNSTTKTISYTVVRRGERIFGIDRDRIRGWHKHEIGRPETHVRWKPTRFRGFIEEVARRIKEIL